jgi:acyl-CoA dehydrogenase
VDEGRRALARWESDRAANFYDATPNLARVLRAHVGAAGLAAIEPRLRRFGGAVATIVEPAARAQESEGSGPRLGREGQQIEFHPALRSAGQAVWQSGILSLPPSEGAAFEQAALMYLLSHAGEAGQACPVACTAGLVRALRTHGSPALQERFLPPLLETDYDRAERGAQFLTEIQSGSDVGANATEAVPDEQEPGAWRIRGEKWFCSVADADQFVVTARPLGAAAGTHGLACFLVPRRAADGGPNGFRIRRLKDKLGTRALATAEIEFDGALAYPIGALENGFEIAAGVVLNTSRWMNALGAAGLMRRAYLEAAGFARHRIAFGRPIGDFPLVRENLAVMKAEEHAALASTMALTGLVDALDTGTAGSPAANLHRFLVNANKYVTSIVATQVTRRAIEALGGNGTIEDFSPLPRLYRDAIVFESWEGTHNILVEQVRRDAVRLDLLPGVLDDLRSRLAALAAPALAEEAAAVSAGLDELEARLERTLSDPAAGALHFRRQLGLLVRAVQSAWLLVEADADASAGVASEKADVAAFFLRRRFRQDYDPEADDGYAELIDRVLAGDVDPLAGRAPEPATVAGSPG